MRKGILFGISTAIAVAIVLGIQTAADWYEYETGLLALVHSPLLATTALAPLVMLVLTPFNKRLLEWRKRRGRDIEEEERFETPGGMISLTRRDD